MTLAGDDQAADLDGIDGLEVLAGSSIRRELLTRLENHSMTREELLDTISTSRVTLWRNLSELSKYGWVDEDEGRYRLTIAGRLVEHQLRNLQQTIEATNRIGQLLDWVPIDEMSFDVARLADATIVTPTPNDPQAPLRLAYRQIRDAESVRILSHALAPKVLDAIYEGLGRGSPVVEGVVTGGVIDAIKADTESRERYHESVDSGALQVYRYDAPIPHILTILDDERVGMGIDDDEGRPQAVLETDDEAVLDWASETYERYRSRARPI